MSSLQRLKAAKSLSDVAAILGYKPSALSFLLYKIPSGEKYETFQIPKKAGGVRQIDAPIPKLKKLQRRLSDLLYECAAEIEAANPGRASLSHAFRKSHSIITNARPHRSRRYVLNFDLKDFFPSLNFGRVRGFFIKNADFELNKDAATVLAQIACNGHVLPQGSPCSPIISELLTHFLDVRLAQFAKQQKCTYSRYADDLTFSTNQKSFPKSVAYETAGGWKLATKLKSKIKDAGFSINLKKTRMHYRGSRQSVTGLVVNTKVNVRSEYYRSARAMAASLFTKGTYYREGNNSVTLKSPATLIGILNHIYHVKERPLDLKIANEKNDELKKECLRAIREHPSALRRLFHRALFFKNFIVAEKPLIICEGKTDSIYLNAAIRKLTKFHSTLASVDKGKTLRKVRFFQYTAQARAVLQLGGGTGDLKHIFLCYKELSEEFGYAPMENPVIVLIDNDSGAKSLFGVIKSKFHVTVDLKTTLPFYHLWKNLYLIKTPEKVGDGISCIEDSFDPALLKTVLGGKTLNLHKEHEAPNEYGKFIFAEQVVKPHLATIDLSGFEPILDRIVAAIDHYKTIK